MKSFEDILLELARLAILEELTGKKLINKEKYISLYPELAQKQAVFVTLNKKRTSGEPVLISEKFTGQLIFRLSGSEISM